MNDSRNSAKLRSRLRAVKTKLVRHLLGADYDLSVGWPTASKMLEINRHYRQKGEATNILSFALAPDAGEILLCPELIAPSEVVSLFIHGLLHLKGYGHGSKMEDAERAAVNFLSSHEQKSRRRTGHRYRRHPSGRL